MRVHPVGNYWVDRNPWQLLEPPEWVLRDMKAYDRELVILPGLTQPVYRLMRKSKAAKAFRPLATDSETGRCARLGVVPVTSIVPSGNWYSLVQWLKDHDIWLAGGAEGAERRLIERDKAAEIAQQKQMLDAADARAESSYFGLKMRSGLTTFVRKETDQPDARPSARTVVSGS
jgi:hypothetical protein